MFCKPSISGNSFFSPLLCYCYCTFHLCIRGCECAYVCIYIYSYIQIGSDVRIHNAGLFSTFRSTVAAPVISKRKYSNQNNFFLHLPPPPLRPQIGFL